MYAIVEVIVKLFDTKAGKVFNRMLETYFLTTRCGTVVVPLTPEALQSIWEVLLPIVNACTIKPYELLYLTVCNTSLLLAIAEILETTQSIAANTMYVIVEAIIKLFDTKAGKTFNRMLETYYLTTRRGTVVVPLTHEALQSI